MKRPPGDHAQRKEGLPVDSSSCLQSLGGSAGRMFGTLLDSSRLLIIGAETLDLIPSMKLEQAGPVSLKSGLETEKSLFERKNAPAKRHIEPGALVSLFLLNHGWGCRGTKELDCF